MLVRAQVVDPELAASTASPTRACGRRRGRSPSRPARRRCRSAAAAACARRTRGAACAAPSRPRRPRRARCRARRPQRARRSSSSVFTCWTKLSCLFEVDAQKSSRTTTRSSRATLALLVHERHRRLLPERRIRQHHVEAVARVGLERVVHGDRAVRVLGADAVQEQVHHAEPRGRVDDLPPAERVEAEVPLLVGVEQRGAATIHSCAASRKPPVPQAGSQIVIPGSGRMTSTIAWISGRGVKYCPAPDFMSSAFFSSSPS